MDLNNRPKSIILYPDQWPALSNLSAQELGWLLEALFRTMRGERGVNLKLDGVVKVAYDFMMTQINLDHEKWERSKALHAERQKRYREKYKVTSRDALPIKDNDNNSDSDSDSNSDSNSTNSSVVSVEKESSLAATKEISDKSANFNEAAARLSKVDDEGWQRNFVYVFNELVKDSNIPPIKRLSKLRLEKLRVLLKDFTTKDIATVCQKAASSNFLNYGGTKHKFQATFDWLIEPENFLRVLEGTYR